MEGDPVPEIGRHAQIDSLSPWGITQTGEVLFVNWVIDLDDENNNYLMIGSESSYSFIDRTLKGLSAPGTEPGVTFKSTRGSSHIFSHLSVGEPAILRHTNLQGPGVDSTNDFGIWRQSSDALTLLVREGDPAPGTQPGVVFADRYENFFPDVGFNLYRSSKSTQLVFVSSLVGPGVNGDNDVGLWVEDDDSFRLVARTGYPAPGTQPGVVYRPLKDPDYDDSFGPLSFDDSGQVAFRALITGPGIGPVSNCQKLWMGS